MHARGTEALGGRGRIGEIALWVLQVLLALYFVGNAAVPKLVGTASAVDMFDRIGVGHWFRYLTGSLELLGAVGLVIPALAGLAGLGLVLVMLGAVITHLVVPALGGTLFLPLVLGLLAAVVAWGRWSRTADVLQRIGPAR
ncbi:hypothetical protein GCM10027174_16390 [Salinifilum aidingensis]